MCHAADLCHLHDCHSSKAWNILRKEVEPSTREKPRAPHTAVKGHACTTVEPEDADQMIMDDTTTCWWAGFSTMRQ